MSAVNEDALAKWLEIVGRHEGNANPPWSAMLTEWLRWRAEDNHAAIVRHLYGGK